MAAHDSANAAVRVSVAAPTGTGFTLTALKLIAFCMAVVTLLSLGFTAYAAREFLVPIAVAFLLAVMTSPIARFLEKRGCSSFASAALVTFFVLASIGGFIWLVIPEVTLLSEQLPQSLAALHEKIAGFRTTMLQLQHASNAIQTATQTVGATPSTHPVVIQEATPLELALSSIARIAAQGAAVFILMFFLLSQRRRMKTIVVAMAKTHTTKKRLVTMFNDIKTRISTYLLAISCTSVGLGVVSAAALYLLGFPNPLLWGAAVTLCNYVPFVGPLVVHLAALFAGAMVYQSVWLAITPAAVLWVLNLIEGQFVTPWFVARRVVLNPLSVCLAVVFGGWIWGVAGAVVAVPALIVAASVIQHWWAPCATNSRRPMHGGGAPHVEWRGWAIQGALPVFYGRRVRSVAAVKPRDVQEL
ncbi:MAG TPA: AI-2E family transporter [Caulobacterales bacterium]|nr:AI-2E family transporter [Caulobacterales bacterium]